MPLHLAVHLLCQKKAKSTEGCNRPKAPTAPWGQVKSPTQPIEHTKEARGVRGGEEDFNIVILSMYKLQRQDEDEQLREFCKLNFLEVLRCLRSMRTVNWQHCTDGRLCRDGLSYLAFFLVMTVRGDTRLTLPPCHPPHDFILPSACIKVTSSGNSYTMQPTEVQHKQQKPPGAFTSFKVSDASVEQRSAAVSVSTPNADVRPKQLSADVSAAGTATATAQNLLFTPSAQAVSAVPKNASDNKSTNEACPEKLATLEPKAIQAKTPATQSCESSPFKRELNLKVPQQRLQQLTSLSHPPPSQNPPPTSLTSDHPASKKEASGGNNESDSEGEALEEKGPDSATVEIPDETPCALCQLKDMAVNFVLTRDPDLRVRLCNSVIYQACVDERYNCWQRTPTVQRYTGTHRAHRRRRPRRNVKHRISRHHSGSEGKALSRAKTRAHSMFQIPVAAAEAGGMTSSSQSNDDPSTNFEALECPTSDNPPETGTNPSRTIDSWENSDFRRTSSSNSTCFDKKTGSKDSSFKNTNFTSGHCVIQRTVLAETQTLCRNKVPVPRKAGKPTRWYHVKRKKNNFCYFLKVLMRRSGQNLSVKPSRRGKRSRIFLAPYSGDVRVRRTNEKKRHRKKVASSCEQLSRALKARNKTGRVKIIAQRTILKSRRKMSNTPQVQGVLRINARDSDAEQKQYDREVQTETANYNQGIGRTVSLARRDHVAEWGMQPADERALTMKVTTRLNKAMLGLSCGGHTLGSEFTDFDHCDDIMASRHVSPMDMSSPGFMDRNVKGTDSNSNDSSTSSSETDVTTTFLGQNPIRRGVNLSLALFCKNELHRSCVALNCNSLLPTRPTAKDVGKDEDILHINKDEAKWVPDDGSEEVSKTMPSLTPHQQLIIRKQQLRPSKLTMQMSEMADASIPCINNTNPSRGQHSRETDHKTIRVHPGPPVLSRLHRLHNPPRLLSYRNSRKSKPSMGIQSGEPIRPTVSQRIQPFPLLQANFCLRGQSIRKAKSLSKLDSRHKDGPSQLRHAVSRPPPQHFVRQTTRPKAGTVIFQSAGGSSLTHTKAIPLNQNFCKAKISKKPQENSPYLSSFLMVNPPPSWK